MIGKIITGKSFSGCISYCLEDKLVKSMEVAFKNRAEILQFNQCFGNQKELIQQFNEVRWLNPNLSKPVLHITLSLAPNEKLDKGTWSEIVADCAKYFGFENNQFMAVSHADTSHQHLHIIANRIGFDKKTVCDSNNYKKMSAWCREMEQKYNLQQVLSPRKFLSKEMRQIPRFDARKTVMKNDVKGSELGYSLATIEKILQLSLQQKQTLFINGIPKELLQKNGLKFNQKAVKYLSEEELKEIKIRQHTILDDLLKPMHAESKVPNEFLKRKKTQHSQHL